MTVKRRKGELRGLVLQIDSDLKAIEHLRETIENIYLDTKEHHTPSTGNQMGLALCLHHIYTAMEEVFIRINKVFDNVPLSSGNWHKELLRNMTMELEDVRPVVISKELASIIDEYRSFRHVVRHAYDYNLDWEKLHRLLFKMPDMLDEFHQEIGRFETLLQQSIKHLDIEDIKDE